MMQVCRHAAREAWRAMMAKEVTFVAETFSGIMVETFRCVPSPDGTRLGLDFVASDGESVRVVVPPMLLEIVADAIRREVDHCLELQAKYYGPPPKSG